MLSLHLFSFLQIVKKCIAVIAANHRQRSTVSTFYFNLVVLMPRVVAPELGDHFILWLLNGTQKKNQIFDSLGIYSHLGRCVSIAVATDTHQ